MFSLMRLVKKIFDEVLQSHSIKVKAGRYAQVGGGGMELQVDLAVKGREQQGSWQAADERRRDGLPVRSC